MNYRSQLSMPSSCRVEVSAEGHPELTRLIEVPRGAPRAWLARAYLLSIGVDARDRDLEKLDSARWGRFGHPISGDRDHMGPTLDRTHHGASEEWMLLPGVLDGLELRIDRRDGFQPAVGDQLVAVLPSESTRLPCRTDAAWQVSPPPFVPDAVDHELAREYGVALPRFDASVLDSRRYGYGRWPLIDELLADLTPARRLALRAHLDEIGLLTADAGGDERMGDAATPML